MCCGIKHGWNKWTSGFWWHALWIQSTYDLHVYPSLKQEPDRGLIIGNYYPNCSKGRQSATSTEMVSPFNIKGHWFGGTPNALSSTIIGNLGFSWCGTINAQNAQNVPALDHMTLRPWRTRWENMHNASDSKMGTWLQMSFRRYFQNDKHLCTCSE